MPKRKLADHVLHTNPYNGVKSWVPTFLIDSPRDGVDRSGFVKATDALRTRQPAKEQSSTPDAAPTYNGWLLTAQFTVGGGIFAFVVVCLLIIAGAF